MPPPTQKQQPEETGEMYGNAELVKKALAAEKALRENRLVGVDQNLRDLIFMLRENAERVQGSGVHAGEAGLAWEALHRNGETWLNVRDSSGGWRQLLAAFDDEDKSAFSILKILEEEHNAGEAAPLIEALQDCDRLLRIWHDSQIHRPDWLGSQNEKELWLAVERNHKLLDRESPISSASTKPAATGETKTSSLGGGIETKTDEAWAEDLAEAIRQSFKPGWWLSPGFKDTIKPIILSALRESRAAAARET